MQDRLPQVGHFDLVRPALSANASSAAQRPTIPRPTQSGTSKPRAPGVRGILHGTACSTALLMAGSSDGRVFNKVAHPLDVSDHVEGARWAPISQSARLRSQSPPHLTAPVRRPAPAMATFLNGRKSDISIWWTQRAVALVVPGHYI